MIDRSLGIFLKALFGMGGITILILAWVQPMPVSERIVATFIGSTGLLQVLVFNNIFMGNLIRDTKIKNRD